MSDGKEEIPRAQNPNPRDSGIGDRTADPDTPPRFLAPGLPRPRGTPPPPRVPVPRAAVPRPRGPRPRLPPPYTPPPQAPPARAPVPAPAPVPHPAPVPDIPLIEPAPVPVPAPVPPPENPASEESSSASDDDFDSADEDLAPPMADPNAPQVVRSSELTSLPTFDGQRGESFINWLEAIEGAAITYRWAENSLIQVAKAKGGPKVVEWSRGNRLRQIEPNHWPDRQARAFQPAAGNNPEVPEIIFAYGFRKLLYDRFGPKFTSATAVNAVSDLKQLPSESCASFMDRVVLAVDKTNFNVPAATKQEAVYQQVQDKAIIAHFGAGLRDSISKTILGAANPPDTVSGMLLAAEAVEAEAAKIGPPGASALAVEEKDVPDSSSKKSSEVSELTEKLDAVMAAMTKAKDKANQKCYNCGQFGHYRRECRRQPSSSGPPAGPPRYGFSGYGSGGRGYPPRTSWSPYSGNRGRGRGGRRFLRRKGQYAIELGPEDEIVVEEEPYDYQPQDYPQEEYPPAAQNYVEDAPFSGNY